MTPDSSPSPRERGLALKPIDTIIDDILSGSVTLGSYDTSAFSANSATLAENIPVKR